MLHHIVLVRWTDESSESERAAARAAMAAFPERIDAIETLTVGADVGLNETNYDLALVATFADEAAWQTYQQHPVHTAFVRDVLSPILAQRAAIQYTT